MPSAPREQIDLARVVPELGEVLSPPAAANELASRARAITVKGPDWHPPRHPPELGHMGFIIVEGFLQRRLLVEEDGEGLEPLGPTDLIRPWQEEAASFVDVVWELPYGPVRLAILDWNFCSAASPAVLVAVAGRGVHRGRCLAVATALESIVGVGRRAWFYLWALAERWGERREDGTLLPVAISHKDLASMIGVRRPSLSNAVAEADSIQRVPEGWLLTGDPP